MKLTRVNTYDTGVLYGFSFTCPGCNDRHAIPVTGPNAWGFNGNEAAPTFTPSILVHPHETLDDEGRRVNTPLCHSFVRDGKIEFLSDSTHALAGQTVELSEVEPRATDALWLASSHTIALAPSTSPSAYTGRMRTSSSAPSLTRMGHPGPCSAASRGRSTADGQIFKKRPMILNNGSAMLALFIGATTAAVLQGSLPRSSKQ